MGILNISADLTIATLVECLLPRFGSCNVGGKFDYHRADEPSKAVLVKVRVSVSDYEADKRATRFVHILFSRPSNITRVWSHYGREFDRPELHQWHNTSNHDSCWRTDGMRHLSDAYFDACDTVNPDVAPRDLSCSAYVDAVHMVEITYDHDTKAIRSLKTVERLDMR